MQCNFWYYLLVFASSKNQSFDWKTSLFARDWPKAITRGARTSRRCSRIWFPGVASSMVIGNLANIEQDTPPHPLKTNMASWNISMFNRRYIFKSWLFFHCHDIVMLVFRDEKQQVEMCLVNYNKLTFQIWTSSRVAIPTLWMTTSSLVHFAVQAWVEKGLDMCPYSSHPLEKLPILS